MNDQAMSEMKELEVERHSEQLDNTGKPVWVVLKNGDFLLSAECLKAAAIHGVQPTV